MRRVLIVSYYFPPAGGPGVQRVMGMVRHLRQFGWEPVVLTVRGGTFFNRDEDALSLVPPGVEVYRAPTVEPFALYNRLRGRAADEGLPVGHVGQAAGIAGRCAHFVRANAFIPDARVGWVPFARRAAKRIVRERKIDVVLTSGPPQSTHLVGYGVARSTGVPWVADFRDPWTKIYYNAELPRARPAAALDLRLEQRCVHRADRIIAVNEMVRDSLGPGAARAHIVSNGFEADDFAGTVEPIADSFTMVYMGNLISTLGDTETLFRVLSRMAEENAALAEALRLRFVGTVHGRARAELERHVLAERAELAGFVPHAEAVRQLREATVALFIGPGDVIGAKVFEYVASGRPLLALAPVGGEVDALLRSAGLPGSVDHSDEQGIAERVRGLFDAWQRGALPARRPMSGVEHLTRVSLTGRIAAALDDAQCGGVTTGS